MDVVVARPEQVSRSIVDSVDAMQSVTSPTDGSDDQPRRPTVHRVLIRLLLAVVAVGFAAFWIWALLFASREAVNGVGDREWAVRAEAICLSATQDRLALADFRVIDRNDPAMIIERADIIAESNRILEDMLDEVVAVEPSDDKGRGIVPLWEDEYRTYIDDRQTYVEQLRESGENLPFYETEVGIPISERIETFAVDNEMNSCAPPRDLSG